MWRQEKEVLEEKIRQAQEKLEDAKFAREKNLKEKIRGIASAQLPPVEDSTIELYELEIGQIQKQLDELYVLRTQNGEMKSDSEGIISSMKIEAGSRTGDGAAFLLTVDEVACQVKCSITK